MFTEASILPFRSHILTYASWAPVSSYFACRFMKESAVRGSLWAWNSKTIVEERSNTELAFWFVSLNPGLSMVWKLSEKYSSFAFSTAVMKSSLAALVGF